jgi:hypothetical protein
MLSHATLRITKTSEAEPTMAHATQTKFGDLAMRVAQTG